MSTGRSVLVVDDDPLLRLIASEVLEKAGYWVMAASDGELALDHLARCAADLVILDIVMPNKDGIEVVVELKQRWPAIKVLAISGGGLVDSLDLLHWASAAGADAVLHKPLKPAALLNAVERLLSEPLLSAVG